MNRESVPYGDRDSYTQTHIDALKIVIVLIGGYEVEEEKEFEQSISISNVNCNIIIKRAVLVNQFGRGPRLLQLQAEPTFWII